MLKLKRIIVIIIIGLLAQACSTSGALLRKERYDEAINKSVKKLQKKPYKEKEIKNLQQAYTIINRKNNERINFLRATGQPDIWEEIFKTYLLMKTRQEKVRVLPENILNQINFKYVNYDEEIIAAQKKAAEYFYAKGISLLERGDRFSAREAYENFAKVKNYYSNFKDIDAQIEKAYSMGQTYVAFQMTNESGIPLPEYFEEDFLKITLFDINTLWVNFETHPVKDRKYHYNVKLKIKSIEISPEMIKEDNWEETKEVNDGYQYVLDANGNVMKDTAGNDIKIPKTKTIKAFVKGVHLKKSCTVSGILDIYNNINGQLIFTESLKAESVFEHSFYNATGDLAALKPETKNKLGGKPIPFPSSAEMIMNTNDALKSVTKSILNRNKILFQ